MKAATERISKAVGFGGISIHAAREGGDNICTRIIINASRFQSTPPVKAATVVHVSAVDAGRISIHAAREGGDNHVLTIPK